jgi:hypothetical protein
MPPVELWSRIPPANSVGTAQLVDGAVTTEKIADGAVTLIKAAPSLKSEHILGDDTEVSSASTSYEEIKKFNFYKDTAVESMNWSTLEVVAEARVDTSGQTATVGLFVDAETSPRLELSYTGTTYATSRGTADISDLATGSHLISIRLKTTGGTAYQRHLEIKAVKT